MIKLMVFDKAYESSIKLHRMCHQFPAYEQMEIAHQLRRASKSICANLVEGFAKDVSDKEKRRFVNIARGSNDEVKLWLLYSKDLGYITNATFEEATSVHEEIGRMLYGLSESLGSTNK